MLEFTHPLSSVVKKARKAQGLTQVQVAEKIGIDSRTIINIENDNAQNGGLIPTDPLSAD